MGDNHKFADLDGDHARLGTQRRSPGTTRCRSPVAGYFAFKERLSFSLKRGSLKALLEDLHDDRLSLKLITKALKDRQEFAARSPSRDAVKMARQLAQMQVKAISLFSAGAPTSDRPRHHHAAVRELQNLDRVKCKAPWSSAAMLEQ
ncbi:hypothetical protein B0T25DRAFT_606336 [Lasiosphaeria hispida]|uniref:Uncharacterized protein n=1 Tax=Lasiosphaeria hispida TaxID=260671 RepID=A0AAJ0MDH9_9PEZI|nr:hypothetical protein B0T25DRAFT_606336 [Lasiosphaeria hispida]